MKIIQKIKTRLIILLFILVWSFIIVMTINYKVKYEIIKSNMDLIEINNEILNSNRDHILKLDSVQNSIYEKNLLIIKKLEEISKNY